jgi:hypothetical protein
MQDKQGRAAERLRQHLPGLATLLLATVSAPCAKPQRQAQALGSACAILEALRRAVPDQDALASRAAELQSAVAAKLRDPTASIGKVRVPACHHLLASSGAAYSNMSITKPCALGFIAFFIWLCGHISMLFLSIVGVSAEDIRFMFASTLSDPAAQ